MTDKQPEAMRLADELDDLNAGRNYDTLAATARSALDRMRFNCLMEVSEAWAGTSSATSS